MSNVTKQQLKDYSGIEAPSALDSYLDLILSNVKLYIENYCGDKIFGRRIFDEVKDDIRKFDGNGKISIAVGDLQEVNSLEVEGVELTEDKDFMLYPLNAKSYNRPFTHIQLTQPETRVRPIDNSRLIGLSPYIFEYAQGNIIVNGKWGYSDEVPADIKLATLKLAGGILQERFGDDDFRELTRVDYQDYSASFSKISETANVLGVNNILKHYKRSEDEERAKASLRRV